MRLLELVLSSINYNRNFSATSCSVCRGVFSFGISFLFPARIPVNAFNPVVPCRLEDCAVGSDAAWQCLSAVCWHDVFKCFSCSGGVSVDSLERQRQA